MDEDGCFGCLAIVIGVALLIGYWYLVIVVAGPIVVVAGGAVLASIFVWNYCVALARTMLPERCGGEDAHLVVPQVAPGDAAEPAYVQYFFFQALKDYEQVVLASARADLAVAQGKWGVGLARWLITGESDDPERTQIEGIGLALSIPVGLVAAGVLIASGIGAVTIAIGFGLIHLAAVLIAIVICGIGADAFRLLESGAQLVRRIRLACPHPGCYRSIALPVYECPGAGCGRRHRHLQPGRYGVFVRTCICHQRLPTLMRQGRHGLAAYCPHCERPLPDHIGSTRATHLPVVGGPSTGKTMLLMASIVALADGAAGDGLEVTFASDADRSEYERARDQLRQGDDLAKTVVQPPRAFLVYVGTGKSRRLVYLYDAAGESTQTTEAAQQLLYLEHAEGLLFVVDPFSIPDLRRRLDPSEESIAVASKPSHEDPDTTLTRIGNVLRSMTGAGAALPVAVVITKGDALVAVPSLGSPDVGAEGETVSQWLETVGLGVVNRNLELMFGDVGYWIVSARAAMLIGADGAVVTAPLRWLLTQTGLPLAHDAKVAP